MELQYSVGGSSISLSRSKLLIAKPETRFPSSLSSAIGRKKLNNLILSSTIPLFSSFNLKGDGFFRNFIVKASKKDKPLETQDIKEKGGQEGGKSTKQDDIFDMDDEERWEWRRKTLEVISANPEIGEEEVDFVEKNRQMKKLVANYPLVVEEEDPDWPDDADGRGFNWDQFFNKITIKNVKKDENDDNYDSDKEIVWQDDDYIRPIKEITSVEWENTVFKDISPLVILVHNRYRRTLLFHNYFEPHYTCRPKENEKIRGALEKAVHIIWNCHLPSPRCVAIDAVIEVDLVSTLKVFTFPELIFTHAGKILYREKAIRTPDELSRIMVFFYIKAAKSSCLDGFESIEELIPTYSSKQA